jgi:hypothetical protein
MPCLLISILDRVCFNAFTSKNSSKELNKSPLRQMFNLALWAHECSKQQHCTKHIALHTDLQRTESRPKLTRFIAATLFRPIVEHHVRRRSGSTGRRCRRRPAHDSRTRTPPILAPDLKNTFYVTSAIAGP